MYVIDIPFCVVLYDLAVDNVILGIIVLDICSVSQPTYDSRLLFNIDIN